MERRDRQRRDRRGHPGGARHDSDVGPIADGDWIGIVRGDGIVAVGDVAPARRRSRCSTSLSTADRELSRSSPAPAPSRRPRRRSSAGSPSTTPTSQVEVHARRSAALPVPVRRRVSAERAELTVGERRSRCVATLRRVHRRRRTAKGVGRQEACVAGCVRRRHRARPRHDLPAAVGRPHERGAHRRPRARRRGARAGHRAQGEQAADAQPAHDRRTPRSATAPAAWRSCSSTSRGASGSCKRGCRWRCSARSTRTRAGCR